ncbi:MAG: hypothetical protein ABI169_08980 [Chitinophagaceae bacterium]
MTSLLLRVFMLSLFLVTVCGCKKLASNNGTFTYKGHILKDCSGTPVALQSVDISFKSGDLLFSSGAPATIEHTTTDMDGNFSVTVPNPGSGSVKVFHDYNSDNPYIFVNTYPLIAASGDTLDFGTIYITVGKYCVINAHTGVSRSDTLYIGASRGDYRTIYPVIQGQSTILSFDESVQSAILPYRSDFALVKAYGKKAFDSVTLLPNQYFSVPGQLCNVRDTTDLIIN